MSPYDLACEYAYHLLYLEQSPQCTDPIKYADYFRSVVEPMQARLSETIGFVQCLDLTDELKEIIDTGTLTRFEDLDMVLQDCIYLDCPYV